MLGYHAARTLPPALLLSAAVIERQRTAAVRLDQLEDHAYADGMEQGKEYKDPDADASSSKAHYDLARYNSRRDAILREASPWLFTLDAIVRRREAEEDLLWDRFERAIGGRGVQA